jgi:hypothetical protein
MEKEIQQLRGQKEELEYILQAHRSVCRINVEQHQRFESPQVKIFIATAPRHGVGGNQPI